MKISLCSAVFLAAAAAGAGVCDVNFKDCMNSTGQSVAVPLMLAEGKDGFTYEGFAEGGADLSVSTVVNGETLQLPYEIESWDPQGVSIVWVRMPSLSAESSLKLSWGEDKQADKPDEEVFDVHKFIIIMAVVAFSDINRYWYLDFWIVNG